jgi:hypothetical protein
MHEVLEEKGQFTVKKTAKNIKKLLPSSKNKVGAKFGTRMFRLFFNPGLKSVSGFL